MDVSVVTRNLARWSTSQRWVDAEANRGELDLLLLQELPAPKGLDVPSGYHPYPKDAGAMQHAGHCQSLALVSERLSGAVVSASFVLPELLCDYVNELVLQIDGLAPLHVFNVHASPRPLDDPLLYPECKRDAERYVYHSDVISSVLVERAKSGADVLAVGDFNEALLWDSRYKTDTSQQFFSRLEAAGLRDVTLDRWGEEISTQIRHPYQVDRVLATGRVLINLAEPSQSIGPSDECSDHKSISFVIQR